MSVAGSVVEQEAEAVSNPVGEPTDSNPEAQAEGELTAEIVELWGRYQKSSNTHKTSKEKLELIRKELGRKLAEVKPLVCRMGRASGWITFLHQHGVARATADRLVKKYGPDGGQLKKVLNEQVSLEIEVLRFRKSVLKKGNQLLPHEYDKYHFVVGLAEDFGVLDKDGCLIEEPEEPENEVEPYDDEFGDDLFMPPGNSSDEGLGTDDEEPAIEGADDNSSMGLGERKRQIEL